MNKNNKLRTINIVLYIVILFTINSCASIYDYAEKGNFQKLTDYLENKKYNINLLNKEGKSLIFIAACNGNFEIVKYLYDKGANIDSGSSFYFNSPIHCSMYNRRDEISKYLIEKNAKIDDETLGLLKKNNELYQLYYLHRYPNAELKELQMLITNYPYKDNGRIYERVLNCAKQHYINILEESKSIPNLDKVRMLNNFSKQYFKFFREDNLSFNEVSKLYDLVSESNKLSKQILKEMEIEQEKEKKRKIEQKKVLISNLSKNIMGYNPKDMFEVDDCIGFYPKYLLDKGLRISMNLNDWKNISWDGMCRKGLLFGRGELYFESNGVYIQLIGKMKNGFFIGKVENITSRSPKSSYLRSMSDKEYIIELNSINDYIKYQK